MTNICYAHNKFGTIEVDGKLYELTEEAQISNRAFPGCFQDVEDGEEYTSEWECRGVEHETDLEVKVVWQFCEIKGAESCPEDLDWDNVRLVRHV